MQRPEPARTQPLDDGLIPDLTIGAEEEARERIACALAVRVTSVTVDRFDTSPSRLTLRCEGSFDGRRYFAKIFLSELYPNPARFNAPWEEENTGFRSRPICEQIDAEWSLTHKMRTLSRGFAVPAPLGKSCAARTIVWEKARGMRLDRIAKRSLWNGAKAVGIQAMFRAGEWLRTIHEASAQGMQMVDISRGVQRFEDQMARTAGAERAFLSMAAKILQDQASRIPAGRFPARKAFTHGDFCLSNLIWERQTRRLVVVDFELASTRPACYDLFALVSHLRAQLFNPLISKSAIDAWETAFWKGYRPDPPELQNIIRALAVARAYYHHLPRLLTRKRRRGWLAGASASLYRVLFVPYVTTHRLRLPIEFSLPKTLRTDPLEASTVADSK